MWLEYHQDDDTQATKGVSRLLRTIIVIFTNCSYHFTHRILFQHRLQNFLLSVG
jgi:hypothetical protein